MRLGGCSPGHSARAFRITECFHICGARQWGGCLIPRLTNVQLSCAHSLHLSCPSPRQWCYPELCGGAGGHGGLGPVHSVDGCQMDPSGDLCQLGPYGSQGCCKNEAQVFHRFGCLGQRPIQHIGGGCLSIISPSSAQPSARALGPPTAARSPSRPAAPTAHRQRPLNPPSS